MIRPFCVEFPGNIQAPCHQSTLSGTRCLLFFSTLHNTLHNKHNVKRRRLEFAIQTTALVLLLPVLSDIVFPSSLHGPLHASFNSEWILQGTGLGGSVMKPGVCQMPGPGRAGRQPELTAQLWSPGWTREQVTFGLCVLEAWEHICSRNPVTCWVRACLVYNPPVVCTSLFNCKTNKPMETEDSSFPHRRANGGWQEGEMTSLPFIPHSHSSQVIFKVAAIPEPTMTG